MKEIKKISDLLDSYISFLTMRMQNRKKNIDIYNQWEIIVEEENLPIESYLDDVKSNTLRIYTANLYIADDRKSIEREHLLYVDIRIKPTELADDKPISRGDERNDREDICRSDQTADQESLYQDGKLFYRRDKDRSKRQ